MASKLPPEKGVQYVFSTTLFSQSDDQIQESPTLATGDVQVSKDGGALANIATLPSESPSGSGIVQVTLSATEMDADEVVVLFKDAAGDEWHNQSIIIHTIASGKQFDDLSTVNDIWGHTTRTLTQGAASVTAAVEGDVITVYRGTYWSVSLTGLGDLSNYDTIYFSVKRSFSDSEDDAILRVKNDASGLERFNKATPAAATNGTIAIDDVAAGDITITVDEVETQNAPVQGGFKYDVKGVDADGQVDLLSIGDGKFNISGDVTRAVT